MALVPDQKFSTFQNGGDVAVGDIIVGLRTGINTRFVYTGELPTGYIVAINQGGTGSDTAAGARANLGLGTMAIQNANAVAITGGDAALDSGQVVAAPVDPTDLVNKTYADAAGTVNSGTANQIAYYATTGTAVSGLTGANSAMLVTNATGVPSMTASMTDGEIIIGSTGGTPTPANITGIGGISIENNPNNITISATGGGISWKEVTLTTEAMVVNRAYVANNAALVTLTLPPTSAFGSAIQIIGKGAGGWSIAQNAGQNIQIGSTSSTVGVGGSVSSANRYDSLCLICTTANTTWTLLGAAQSTGLNIV